METIRINNTVLEFNRIIYVDAVKGNDETGDGSENNPYKTFNKAYSYITTNNNEAIYLKTGEYICSVDDTQLKSMSIIGEGYKTILTFNHSLRRINNSERVMYSLNNIKFYRFIFKTIITGANLFHHIDNCIFYNIVFDLYGTSEYSSFGVSPSGIAYFYNCLDVSGVNKMLRGSGFYLINCYGKFTAGYNTSQSNWNIQASILKSPQTDSKYNLLTDDWENIGVGTNPDGTQAHIGVYGGKFAWGNWTKSLLKSNNKYYTYQDNEFIEVEPTVENFKGKSIYLPDLTTPTDKVVLTMEGGEELEDGRLYRKTIDISKYKDIERIEVKRGEKVGRLSRSFV